MYSADLAVFVLGLVVFLNTQATGTFIKYAECAKKKYNAELKTVDVTPCPTQPCEFPRGVTVHSTIKFIPNETVTSGKLAVYGIIQSVKVPFPLAEPKACSNHNLSCPLQQGVPAYLAISFHIGTSYPALALVAQFELKDQNAKEMFCFQLPCQIGVQKEGVVTLI